MKKEYTIFLDGKKIGKTLLEKADAPMGLVLGTIISIDANLNYDFLESFCENNKIEFEGYPKEKLITIGNTELLKVISPEGIEIKGVGNQISGMDDDVFEVTIMGIPYPFYGEEFTHHVKSYEELWNKKKKD